MKISPSLIKAFFLFPFNVMGTVPAFLLWCSRPGGWLDGYSLSFGLWQSIVGTLLIVAGVFLCWVTVSLFTEIGQGTPAPFDPPKKLVVQGIYRHSRNPMMVGVWCVLLGESILFGSLLVMAWCLFFVIACLLVIPLWEEPELEKRFGESYLNYKGNVPRWFPRLAPWKGKN
jgi:protein-S-isoprenylcysteine O-methyltransferase Ste14